MGGSESKHTDESKKLNTSQPSEDENHTPLVNRRLTRLTDPRSPTDGVDRTPIVAEKTDGDDASGAQALRIDTSKTSEVTDAPDPRSPSCNVARTPQPFTFNDPRSPSGDVARTPFIPHSEEGGDPRSPTPGIERTPFVPNEGQETENADIGPRTSSFECLVDEPTPSVQENLNSSNNNIENDQSLTELEPDLCDESQTLIKTKQIKSEGLTQINTPQYEVELSKMVEQQSLVTVYCEPEKTSDSEEEDAPGIISATDASEHKPKSKTHKRSLKDRVQEKFHGGVPRSPLSTRNLLSDSPSLQLHSGSNSVSYVDKASMRRRHTAPTPTRLVGRYEPIVDKENV